MAWSSWREHQQDIGAWLLKRRMRIAPTRVLAIDPALVEPGPTARRFNVFARAKEDCRRYLEIGVQDGRTFEAVAIAERWAVEPWPRFDTKRMPPRTRVSAMPSDRFFARLDSSATFDAVFIDGLHESHQAYRDLLNSLRHCSPTGIIIIDDVLPDDELAGLPDLAESLRLKHAAGIEDGRWQGDVYKVVKAIHDHHPELEYRVIGVEDRTAQAIVWHRRPAADGHQTDPRALDRYFDSIAYADVFIDGRLPDWFNVRDEETGLAEALAALGSGTASAN